MILKKTLIMLSVALLVGCQTLGKVIPMPKAPLEKFDSVTFEVERASSAPPENNIVMSKGHTIPLGSRVVINIPVDLSRQMSREKERLEQERMTRKHIAAGNDINNNSDEGAYSTSGYFHEAEQEIERELIRHGFNVLSRARLEAKLRDLRDKAGRKSFENDVKYSDGTQELLNMLKKSFETGKIDINKYKDEKDKLLAESKLSEHGRNRRVGESEMTDISEVIRAAQDGVVSSDYLLQINTFNTNHELEYGINILANSKVRDFMQRNRDAADQIRGMQNHKCKELSASLNAKLIHVKTGRIVWIGDHVLTTRAIQDNPLSFEIRSVTKAGNIKEVTSFVNRQNTDYMRKTRGDRPVSVPEFVVETIVTKPVVVSGHCDIGEMSNEMLGKTKKSLSKLIAKSLIKTIDVSSKMKAKKKKTKKSKKKKSKKKK